MRPRARLVALALAIFATGCQPSLTAPGDASTREERPATLVLTVSDDDPSRGPAAAPVTVVVFGDYGCLHCRRANDILAELQADPTAPKFRVVWKSFPADDEDSVSAAVLAHGLFDVGGNGAFWAFHDMVYRPEFASLEMRSRVARGLAYARDGLDADTQTIAKAAQQHGVDQVRSSVEMGSALGVHALPTLFVNGHRMVGVKDAASVRALIEEEAAAIAPLLGDGATLAAAMDARLRSAAEADPLLFSSTSAAPSADTPADAQADELPTPTETVFRVPVGASPSRGPADAPVTIVAFTDFECGHCQAVQPTLRALLEEFPRDVRIVVKHSPLPFHPGGLRASLFAAWVREQKGDEAFFQVHDALYEEALEDATFRRLATAVGLDPEEALRAIDEQRALRAVEDDLLAADDVGARSTPTFFINGRGLVGALPKEAFVGAVRAELARLGDGPRPAYEDIVKGGFTVPLPPRVDPPTIGAKTPARGPKKAPLVLHVFADFECHFCRLHAKNVQRLEEEFAGTLRVVFHSHPLRGARARRAALAGMEAFNQKGHEGFFAFHDLVFAREGELNDGVLEEVFRDAGLDASRLAAAFENPTYASAVDAEVQAASDLGLTGTPMSVLNGQRVSGAVPYVRLRKFAELSLREAGVSVPTPRAKPKAERPAQTRP